MRFERGDGERFERIFPETFSFRAEHHDPAELYLQLEDLWTTPRRIAPAANRRDAERAMRRLVTALPGYLERMLDRLEGEGRLDAPALARLHGDVAVLVHVVMRFLADKDLDQERELQVPSFHLRKLAWRTLDILVAERVSRDFVRRFVAGDETLFDPGQEISETALFYALAGEDGDAADRTVMALADAAFHRWFEDVCLDEANQAFEGHASPFGDRESEVLRVATAPHRTALVRGRDFAVHLRRRRNRDCLRMLEKLEAWFLRQYDVPHAAAAIKHRSSLERDLDDADRVLSLHSPRNYLLALLGLTAPLWGAVLAYDRAPRLFDALVSIEVAFLMATVFWFLLYQFSWKKDLSFFHASVPRIGAGIIVGYLPVFLIDEVWDLAGESWATLLLVVSMLGFATLLYLYVEVQRRLGNPQLAFARARSIFLLGVVEAFALGMLLTSLFGRFMAERNWAVGAEEASRAAAFEAMRATLPPVAGQLPPIAGYEPFLAFPSAMLLMTFLSFFIGTFLQLMWEDIPLTEPL